MTCDSTMVLQHHVSCLWFPRALVLEAVKAPDRGSVCWEAQRCRKSRIPPKGQRTDCKSRGGSGVGLVGSLWVLSQPPTPTQQSQELHNPLDLLGGDGDGGSCHSSSFQPCFAFPSIFSQHEPQVVPTPAASVQLYEVTDLETSTGPGSRLGPKGNLNLQPITVTKPVCHRQPAHFSFLPGVREETSKA